MGKVSSEIMHDDRGFDDDVPVVDERRHHAVRVELEIGGVELITVQGHHVAFPFQPFFRQSQSRLLGADGCKPVIEFEHGFLLVYGIEAAQQQQRYMQLPLLDLKLLD